MPGKGTKFGLIWYSNNRKLIHLPTTVLRAYKSFSERKLSSSQAILKTVKSACPLCEILRLTFYYSPQSNGHYLEIRKLLCQWIFSSEFPHLHDRHSHLPPKYFLWLFIRGFNFLSKVLLFMIKEFLIFSPYFSAPKKDCGRKEIYWAGFLGQQSSGFL